jgi:hypothetical protein
VPEHGGTLVIRGDAGIGKSSLTAAASDAATARGMSVLRTVGVEPEAHLPFAGLHQLLQPIFGGSRSFQVRSAPRSRRHSASSTPMHPTAS